MTKRYKNNAIRSALLHCYASLPRIGKSLFDILGTSVTLYRADERKKKEIKRKREREIFSQ